jgi:phosphinothricin acetyltransferase
MSTTQTSPADTVTIRALTSGDAAAVEKIYQDGIYTGHATFEPKAPDWSMWDRKHRQDCRLVAALDDDVIGWAALLPVSARPAYAGVVEISVYVTTRARGKGAGKLLLAALITCAEGAGLWTLKASIFPENRASLALHKAQGFRIMGTEERIGKMPFGPLAGTWRNVVRLERRSIVTGLD